MAYPVEKENALPDPEAGIYLECLDKYGHLRATVDGFEHAIDNMLYVLKNRRYVIGYPGNEELVLDYQDPYVVNPTQAPLIYLEQGSGSYTLEIRNRNTRLYMTNGSYNKSLGDVLIGHVPVMIGSKYDVFSQDPLVTARDPNEPPGYFITNGRKRTFNEPENLSAGSILCYYKDLKLDPTSLVASLTTESRFMLTAMYSIYLGAGRILRFDNFRTFSAGMKKDSLDVLDAFTLLGYKDIEDGEDGVPLAEFIIQFTRPEWRGKLLSALAPSIARYYEHRPQPIPYRNDMTGSMVYPPDPLLVAVKRIQNQEYAGLDRSHFTPILRKELYSHITASTEEGLQTKAATLARQIVRLIEVDLGLVAYDDRNSYRNKRLKAPGPAMLHLFNLALDENHKDFYSKFSAQHPTDKLRTLLQNRLVSQDYEHAFEKSWSIKGGHSMKASNYVEILKDNQFVLQHTHISKVIRGRDPNSKNFPIRAVQPSQPPFIDISETPESGNVGLNNVKSSGSYLSQHHDITVILDTIVDQATTQEDGYISMDFMRRDYYDTIFCANGIVQGVCNGNVLEKKIVDMRRAGIIPRDVEVTHDKPDGYLYMKTDAGRMLIPLFVVEHDDNGIPYLTIEEKGLNIDTNPGTVAEWQAARGIDLLDPTECDRHYVCIGLKEMKSLVNDLISLRERLNAIEEYIETFDDNTTLFVSLNDEFTVLSLEGRNEQIVSELSVLNNSLRRAILDRNDASEAFIRVAENIDDISYQDKIEDARGVRDRANNEMMRIANRIQVLTKEYNHTKALTVDDLGVIYTRLHQATIIAERLCAFTYCLPDPMMMLGITSALLVLHNHNPGPRQTFACKMIKQSMILPSHSQRWLPVPCKYGVLDARGPVETIAHEYVGLHTHPSGTPMQILMFIGQNTTEDMIAINRQWAESGAGLSVWSKIVTKKIPNVDVREAHGVNTSITRVTNKIPKEIVDRKRRGKRDVFANLGPDGVVLPGSVVREGDCIIGAYIETATPDGPVTLVDISRYVKKNKAGVVKDIVYVKGEGGETIVHIHINEMSVVERGDKFGNPHAQKATVGDIIDPWDMPQNMTDGSIPSGYVNSHCFPSRMTVALLIEMLLGKVHALTGERFDGTPFHDSPSLEDMMDTLLRFGFSRGGKDRYYFPKTGEVLDALIFNGTCQYFKLEHKCQPKLQVRYIGKNNARTHQSVTGIENGGGQRVGHMEHDVQRTHGASDTITQWATRAADYFVMYACAQCDTEVDPTRVNGRIEFMCKECGTYIKNVKYAVTNVGSRVMRKYSTAMGYSITPYLAPKQSLYLPTLTSTVVNPNERTLYPVRR